MKNLLLLVVDCARADKTVAELPGATALTRRSASLPYLDALRERGTTWTQYLSVSSTTTPNFATMFTGLLPREHGIVEHSRHALHDVTTLAEILRARGWHTHAEVTGPLLPETGLGRGFDGYRWRDRSEYFDSGFAAHLRGLLAALPEPWFCVVHAWEAHQPYRVRAPYDDPSFGLTPYDRALSALDAQLSHALADLDLDRTTVVWCGDHGERLDADWELRRAAGDPDVPAYDAWRRLAARGGPFDFDRWFEHAGQALGPIAARVYAHNVLGHGFHVTEDLVRTPLVIVDGERCAEGAVRDELRSQVDLFPTLLDLAGIEDHAAVAERSFLRAAPPTAVYVEANGSGGKREAARAYLRGARTERFKYWRLEADGLEHRVLWDLTSDPGETRDVSREHSEETARLDACVDEWLGRSAAGARTRLEAHEEERLASTLRSLGYL